MLKLTKHQVKDILNNERMYEYFIEDTWKHRNEIDGLYLINGKYYVLDYVLFFENYSEMTREVFELTKEQVNELNHLNEIGQLTNKIIILYEWKHVEKREYQLDINNNKV